MDCLFVTKLFKGSPSRVLLYFNEVCKLCPPRKDFPEDTLECIQ